MSHLRRLSELLLDQQMWCWGRDICHHEGNLLLKYGFTRHAPPDKSLNSYYQWGANSTPQLVLWGFGLFYGCPTQGGLFLKRFEFTPRLVKGALQSIWQADHLPTMRKPKTVEETHLIHQRLEDSLTWIGHYEKWVLAQVGLEYRQASLRSWHKKVVVPAEAMAATWQELAAHWRNQFVTF